MNSRTGVGLTGGHGRRVRRPGTVTEHGASQDASKEAGARTAVTSSGTVTPNRRFRQKARIQTPLILGTFPMR